MSREALVLLVCCCDFRDGAEWLIPSKSLRNAVIRAFPGLFCILRMCAPRRAAAVVRPRGREKSADRRRRILISRLLIIRASVPRRKSPFPAYFKGFPAVSLLIPPYPAFLKYPVSPQSALCPLFAGHRPKPHSEAALHFAAGSGNAFSKEQLDRCTGVHLCTLSTFQSCKRFEMQHFQHNTCFFRTGKCTARRTCPQRLFQAQSHSAQGSSYYAELRCHSMQKCRA